MSKSQELLDKLKLRNKTNDEIIGLINTGILGGLIYKIQEMNHRLSSEPNRNIFIPRTFIVDSVELEGNYLHINSIEQDYGFTVHADWLLNNQLIEDHINEKLEQRELAKRNQIDTDKENRRQRYLKLKEEFESATA